MYRYVIKALFGAFLVLVLFDLVQWAVGRQKQRHEAKHYREQRGLEEYIRKIVRDELEQKNKKADVLASCKTGFVRGSLAGLVTGGPPAAITGGVVNGILTPLFSLMQ